MYTIVLFIVAVIVAIVLLIIGCISFGVVIYEPAQVTFRRELSEDDLQPITPIKQDDMPEEQTDSEQSLPDSE